MLRDDQSHENKVTMPKFSLHYFVLTGPLPSEPSWDSPSRLLLKAISTK